MLVVYQRTSKKGKIYGGKKSLLHTKTIQAVETLYYFKPSEISFFGSEYP